MEKIKFYVEFLELLVHPKRNQKLVQIVDFFQFSLQALFRVFATPLGGGVKNSEIKFRQKCME